MRYLIVLLALCGCAEQRWHHDSKETEQAFNADWVQCERLAVNTYWASDQSYERGQMTARCMYAKGWTRK